jgi:hypothetical protein
MATVFDHGYKAMKLAEAVAALMKLTGLTKSPCYRALDLKKGHSKTSFFLTKKRSFTNGSQPDFIHDFTFNHALVAGPAVAVEQIAWIVAGTAAARTSEGRTIHEVFHQLKGSFPVHLLPP